MALPPPSADPLPAILRADILRSLGRQTKGDMRTRAYLGSALHTDAIYSIFMQYSKNLLTIVRGLISVAAYKETRRYHHGGHIAYPGAA